MAQTADTHTSQATIHSNPDEVGEMIEALDLRGVQDSSPIPTIDNMIDHPLMIDIEELPEELRPFAYNARDFRRLQQAEKNAGVEGQQGINQPKWGMSPRMLAEVMPSKRIRNAAEERLARIARRNGQEGPIREDVKAILAINIYGELISGGRDASPLWNVVAGARSVEELQTTLTDAMTQVMGSALRRTTQFFPQLEHRSQ